MSAAPKKQASLNWRQVTLGQHAVIATVSKNVDKLSTAIATVEKRVSELDDTNTTAAIHIARLDLMSDVLLQQGEALEQYKARLEELENKSKQNTKDLQRLVETALDNSNDAQAQRAALEEVYQKLTGQDYEQQMRECWCCGKEATMPLESGLNARCADCPPYWNTSCEPMDELWA